MSGRLAFNLVVLAAAAYFVASATGYEPAARRIPVMIGLLVFALQAWVTLRELRHPPALPSAADYPAGEWRSVAAMAGWMALFFALFAVLGTLVAVFAFILLFLARAGLAWWRSAAIAGALSGGLWLVFARLMRFELYAGVVFGAALPAL